MKTMKAYVLGGAATFGLALAIYAQTPGATPETPAPSPTLAATATPLVTATPPASVSPAISATPSAANQFADKIKERVDRKFKHKGFAITVDGNDGEEPDSHRHHGDDDIPAKVLPIAIISVLAVFGFPVAIVAVIMFSSWTRTLLASWFAAINRPCAVFCASWCGPTWNWPTISPRKRLFALTKTSGVSEAKRNSPPGFIESLTTFSARMPANAKSLSGSMKNGCRLRSIHKRPIPRCVTIS